MRFDHPIERSRGHRTPGGECKHTAYRTRTLITCLFPPQRLLISAGHGTHIKDLNGDEDDGRDEAIVPAGCKAHTESELLIDDVIFEEVRARISCHGVYLTLTLTLNLPYVGIG